MTRGIKNMRWRQNNFDQFKVSSECPNFEMKSEKNKKEDRKQMKFGEENTKLQLAV